MNKLRPASDDDDNDADCWETLTPSFFFKFDSINSPDEFWHLYILLLQRIWRIFQSLKNAVRL